MFRRKTACIRCGNKIERAFSYCPFCGAKIAKKKSSGWLDEPFDFNELRMKFPFSSLFKEIDKHLKDFDQALWPKRIESKEGKESREGKEKWKEEPFVRSGISISISSTGGEPTIRVRPIGFGKPMIKGIKETKEEAIKVKEPTIKTKKLNKREAEALSKLPKTEPSTKVRRLTDRIIYEIDLPGVQEKDVIVNKLQNSIEIKAFTKNKAFFKLIPVALPILRYYLEKEKLILELKPEI